MHRHNPDQLSAARYARLRSFRGDGTPVDTPVWFALDGRQLLFRTKVGPKTRRLATRREVELAVCDYRGRVRAGAAMLAGHATILSGAEAEQANRALHRRYGWRWNIVPLINVPGVTNVHRDLCLGEKLRRSRDRAVWSDSVIVRVELANA
jgi:uncharacterized protein